MAGQGLDRIPLRIPEKWDAAWFETFVRDVLSQADVRNAIEGPGISVTGQSDEPATLAASADFQALLDASLLTATAPVGLGNARQLVGEPGVIELVDDGSIALLSLVDHGLPLSKLSAVSPYSILGDDTGTGLVVEIPAADGDILSRSGAALGFGQSLTGAIKFTNAGTAIELEGATPRLLFDGTGAPTDERLYDFVSTAGNLEFRTRTDADGAGASWLTVTRTGTTIDSLSLTAGSFVAQVIGSRFQLSAVAPELTILEAAAATDEKVYDFASSAGQLLGRTRTDAFGAGATWLTVDRTGTTVDEIQLDATTLDFNGAVVLDSPIRLFGYTVATLPAGTQGDTAYVTDALAPAFLTAVVGGGAIVAPVFYDGTNWIAF